MTKDEFLIELGIEVDTEKNEKQIDALIESVRKSLNQDFELDIEEGNLDKISDAVKTLGAGIRTTVDESSGLLSTFAINFESANGGISTLLINFKKLKKEIISLEEAVKRGLNLEGGSIISSDGEEPMFSTGNKTYQTTLTNKQNPSYILADIIDKYKELESLQRQSANTDIGTEKYRVLQDVIDSLTESVKEDAATAIQTFGEGSKEAEKVTSSFKKYQAILKQIQDLSKAKTDDVAQREKESETVKVLTNTLKEYSRILSDTQKIESSDSDTFGAKLDYNKSKLQELVEQLTRYSNGAISFDENTGNAVLETDKLSEASIKGSKSIKQLEEAVSSYNDALKQQEALDSHQQDAEKISNAVSKLKELVDARKALISLESKGGSSRELQTATVNVDKLREELKNLNSEVLQNGKSVRETAGYTEELAVAQKKVESESAKAQREKESETVKILTDSLKQYLKVLSDTQKIESSGSDTFGAKLDYNKVKLQELVAQLTAYSNGAISFDKTTGEAVLETDRLSEASIKGSKSIKQLEDAVNNYNDALRQQQALESHQQDTKKISDAVSKLKELVAARKTLISLQTKGSKPKEMQEAIKSVNQLEKELKELTTEVVQNGKSVEQTTEYTEQFARAQQDLANYTRRSTAGINENVSVLGKLFGSIGQVINNVVKYNLAQFGLNETIQKTVGVMKELDEAMTNIRLVTGQSESTAKQMLDTYADMAYELGSTTAQVAEGKIMLSFKSL